MKTDNAISYKRPRADACIDCDRVGDCFLAEHIPAERFQCDGIVHRRIPVFPGEYVFRRDQAMKSVFLVCSGGIKTQRETPDGALVVNGFYLPGDVVGIDALADSHYSADAIATCFGQLCSLNCSRLVEKCSQQPAMSTWLLSKMSEYARRKDNDLAWSTGLHTRHRVLRFFVELHERLAQQSSAVSQSARLPMRKQDVARYLNMTPETLSRNLAALQRDGLLKMQHDSFALPDMAQARAITLL